MSTPIVINKPAPGVPFFSPAQNPPSGTAVEGQPNTAKLFTPIKIRGLEFQNRIFVPPLCQYSADNGHATPWHMAHIGGIVSRGFGLTFIEATAVSPEGRITPECLGIWQDSQIEPLKQLVDFAHSQGQKIGIQLAHAGRKASTVAPWLHPNSTATAIAGGWPEDIVGPSPIAFSENNPVPKELTKTQIASLVKSFANAARRALRAGFDVIEIHNAHGYLLNSFISPVANERTDEYGGSFENRIRFTLEVVDAVRAVIPEHMPLFLRYELSSVITSTFSDLCMGFSHRISASDRLEEFDEPSWKNEDTIRFASILADHEVDFLDVSSAGNSLKQTFKILDAQQLYSAEIKKAVGDKILVGTVGGIKSGHQAEKYLQEDVADAVFVGRHTQKEPGNVWKFAEELGVQIHVAGQIGWGFYGRGSGVGSKWKA
ncbi:hypothetical protein D9758_006653 [Tetrapyrgos nigripes]|uniref:NADH:flavin oxidoreductase/NADH oxidase N-terminal domain-containing protein n=1 Tax=Tetrapyrgos nigripes TaxID=182062 RepID=A0A8H5GJD8_9AGAR|nr:hypothetical protein D9758_006653 [Tetrapyrgos nigripes]